MSTSFPAPLLRHPFLRGTARHLAAAGTRACAQVPVLAFLAGFFSLFYFAVFSLLMDPGPSGLWDGVMLALFLLFMGLFHFSLLLAGNAAAEALLPGGRFGRGLDLLKVLVLAPAAALMTVSTLKYTRTQVPLRVSDLWFLSQNIRQIVSEGTWGEKVMWAGFLLALLAGAALLWWGLLRGRRGARPRLGVRGAMGLAVLAIAGLAAKPPGSELLRDPIGSLVREPVLVFKSYAAFSGIRAVPRLGQVSPEAAEGPVIRAYAPAADPARLNLVLVVLEAVPWNAAGYNGGPAGATPRLDALAGESMVFARPYAASSQSHYSQMAILSSLFPHKFRGPDYYNGPAYPRALLWDALRPAGYATAMFSCQNEYWGNMILYLRTPGLEVFRHCKDWPDARHRSDDPSTKVWEETVVTAWGEWLAGLKQRPFFTYLNFQATHFPYEIPPGAAEPYTPCVIDFPCSFAGYPASKIPVMRNRFNNALRYSDAWLGAVVDRLREAGEWDRTVLAVVSDHGEAFLEHGKVCHGADLHEEQVRSLMMVRVPGLAPRRVEEPVSHLDLAPALLRLLGLPPNPNFQGRGDIVDPAYRAEGRSLYSTLQGMTAWDGVLLDGWKYAIHWDLGAERLYNLSADPGELDDRSAGSLKVRELGAGLRRFLEVQETYYEGRLWEKGFYPRPLP